MLSTHAVCLVAAFMISARQEPELPAAWKQKYEAAAKAIAAGHPIQAEARLAEIVAEAEKLGPDDLRLADPLEWLAAFYADKHRKRYAEAEPLLRRALAIREKAQGPDHREVAQTLRVLAMCRMCANEKQVGAAGPLLRRAMNILEKSKLKEDPDLAEMLHTVAIWHLLRKELDPGEAMLTRALAIREKAVGPNDPKVANLLDDLGDLHAGQAEDNGMGEMEATIQGVPRRGSEVDLHGKQAETFYKRALAIREKALKPDDPAIAESLFNLGQLATIRDQPVEGETYFERWLMLEQKRKAPPNERQAKVLLMLAGSSMAQKDLVQSERRLARTQEVSQEVYGLESEEVSSLLSMRAMIAIDAGRFDDAERFLKRGLEIEASLLGPDDDDLKATRTLMAGRYQDQINDRRAPVLWRRLETLGEQVLLHRQHTGLVGILDHYGSLLRRTNRVLPPATEEDLAYLKKVGAMISIADLNFLRKTDSLLDGNLDDTGLSHIARLYDLEKLNLNQTVTDAGLAYLKDLVNLRWLMINWARITDAGLAHLKGLTNLNELHLSGTRITDGGLTLIGRLEHLEVLTLAYSRVTGAGLAHLQGLKNLHELDLTYTNVTDAGLEHLKGLVHLRKINLTSTKVTEAGIDKLRQSQPGLEIEYKRRPAGFPDDPTSPDLEPKAPAPGLVPTRPAAPPLAAPGAFTPSSR